MDIISNLEKTKEMIRRASFSVCLLAVSKTKSTSQIEEAIHAGQFAFGENYVQEAAEKIQILNQKYSNLEWHYIGRIQKNKINLLANYFDWVQTVENEEVAKKLNAACEKMNKKLNVCIQVNISEESQKGGIFIHEVNMLASYIFEECPNLYLRGLMTIGLATEDKVRLKMMFCQLKSCYDGLKKQYARVDTLSMGMSHDMALAIECGSTMVRIGTAIFGEREKS
ncbi:MAG: YggS family pyridoxal phosphate-dependent enzyme [Pseudomonadota bacterium]